MTFWNRTTPRARKEHTCTACGRGIAVGETYLRGVEFDGTAWTWRECAHCELLFRYLSNLWDFDEYTFDMAWDWDPKTDSAARVKAAWASKWRQVDGALYPLPVLLTHWRELGDGFRVEVIDGVVAGA